MSGRISGEKKEQYNYVASIVKDTIDECGYEDNKESFELAKKMILNNELLSIRQGLENAFRTILRYAASWIASIVSFVVGVITACISNNIEEVFNIFWWKVFIIVIVYGFVIDILINIFCDKIEKPVVRKLKEMTYDEYRFLINYIKKEKSKAEEKII